MRNQKKGLLFQGNTYVLDKVNKTVAGSFRSNEASTPVNTFTSKHTSKLVSELLVSTEKVADLSSASPDITSCSKKKKKSQKGEKKKKKKNKKKNYSYLGHRYHYRYGGTIRP